MIKELLCNFLAQKLQHFAHKKLKKPPSKVSQKYSIFFPVLLRAVQTAKTEEFMLQNVAYRPTVYKTGE